LLYLKGVLDPVTQIFADLKLSKLKRVLNHVIVDAKSSPVLRESLFARFFRRSWLSVPIPPFVPKTKGVKVPISTLKTLFGIFLKMARVLLFWLLHELTRVTRTSKNVAFVASVSV